MSRVCFKGKNGEVHLKLGKVSGRLRVKVRVRAKVRLGGVSPTPSLAICAYPKHVGDKVVGAQNPIG